MAAGLTGGIGQGKVGKTDIYIYIYSICLPLHYYGFHTAVYSRTEYYKAFGYPSD